jgi:hypothetical protein
MACMESKELLPYSQNFISDFYSVMGTTVHILPSNFLKIYFRLQHSPIFPLFPNQEFVSHVISAFILPPPPLLLGSASCYMYV